MSAVGASAESAPEPRPRVRLLDIDADLAATVPEEERDRAGTFATVTLERLEPGPWSAPEAAEPGCLGLLVVRGLVSRDVAYGGMRSRELLGRGDVLRPWDVADHLLPVSPEASWTVVEAAELASMDRSVLRLGARWPELIEELMHRILHRSRGLAVQLAVTGMPRVDQRLLYFLWHAAGRWGLVTPEGTLVPFNLTHDVLADLVEARRPSVTTALKKLRRDGKLERVDDGWLLKGEPPNDS